MNLDGKFEIEYCIQHTKYYSNENMINRIIIKKNYGENDFQKKEIWN